MIDYTTLVFKTLRVGFPNAKVIVWINDASDDIESVIKECCSKVEAQFFPTDTIHHEWIEELINKEDEPFYLLDTDVIFYGSFEEFTFDKALAGWRIPEWVDDFSGCVTRSRLHTSLLYCNPQKIRDEIKMSQCRVMESEFTPKASLIYPSVVPFKRQMFFYDTCSMLYHAIGGQAFEPKHKNVYTHLNFGTISDMVLPRLKNGDDIQEARKKVMENHSLGIGAWRSQERYYEQRML